MAICWEHKKTRVEVASPGNLENDDTDKVRPQYCIPYSLNR